MIMKRNSVSNVHRAEPSKHERKQKKNALSKMIQKAIRKARKFLFDSQLKFVRNHEKKTNRRNSNGKLKLKMYLCIDRNV